MSTIAVFFSKPGSDDYPFDKEYYRTAYREVAEEVMKRGGTLCIVRSQETYLGGNRFSRYWEFDGEWFKEKNEEIDADVIYVKSQFRHDAAAHLVNDPELDVLCIDKWKTYEMFPSLHMQTFIVHSREDVEMAVRACSTGKLVAKPVDGEEGIGVSVIATEDAPAVVTQFPYLLQEFIDTSNGIPGIVEGTHDFRIISINGEPVLSFVRTPPQGSYLANVAQGGKKIEVDLERIPQSALAVQQQIDEQLKRFGTRIYSVDMGLSADGTWKIIELNSQPGCTCKNEGPGSVRFQERLADLLVLAASPSSRRH